MKPRILVVDDNDSNLKLARWVLASEGFEVEEADSAEAALARLGEPLPELILMDIAMPGMDGLDLTRLLRANPATRDIPIVAMTAFAMKGDKERAFAAGCDAYITKPVDTRTLPGKLHAILRARSRV